MKKLLLLVSLFITILGSAQVPQGISYQAIALNGAGSAVVNSNVGLRLSVLNTSATGTVVYSETHTKTTNTQGLFNLVIGQGSVVSGTFAGINWANGSKFLKVEMDAAGGTNYTLVGTTQLLSVPYALAAKSFAGAPGEGITLTSPNGTPYTLSVNDNGQLSLPTSSDSSVFPSDLYLFGSYNSFNQTSANLLGHIQNHFYGYKYLTSGSQIKLTAANVTGAAIYGFDSFQNMVLNGAAYTASSTAFYYISIQNFGDSNFVEINSIAPTLITQNQVEGGSDSYTATYNAGTNQFTFTVNGVTNNDVFLFDYPSPGLGGSGGTQGDNLADGTIDNGGTPISFPGSSSTPKNYSVKLTLNVNGSGTYTITQI
ncbi:hypothetical protein [Flavobacterium silvaticum]|uniref:Uncharacterized protein n=1 Tax=Flavobacterium silvaticum TaxID=1852020 RepID=A0A972JI40_9FLAO|nr:hypothetical protein [Flavobacterium silvaticum]NMH27793.1 hypothetical protein [Flavobacterium silvaticum]